MSITINAIPSAPVTPPATIEPVALTAEQLDGIVAALNAAGVSVSGGVTIGSTNLETLTVQHRDDGSGTPNFLVTIQLR